MAGLEEEVKDGSDGFPAKLFLDRCIVEDGPETSHPICKARAAAHAPKKVAEIQNARKKAEEIEEARRKKAAEIAVARRNKAEAFYKPKMNKAKHAAGKGEIQRQFSKGTPVKTWKAAAAFDKTKTNKAAVEGEKTTSLIIGTKIQTDVQYAAESDPPTGATGEKNRMPAELVSYILAMPIDKPDDIVMPAFLEGEKNMAEILGVTEEWLENKRQTYRDAALSVQRHHANFLKYQVEIRDEFLEKGFVEVDDDYLERQAEIGEKMRAYWEELHKKRGPTLTYVADYSEYDFPYDYEEQVTRLVDLHA